MSKNTFFYKVSAMTVAAYCISCSTAFAASDAYSNDKNRKTKVPTEQITIFEVADEERAYDQHGFTRGDMTKLYKGNFEDSEIENITGDVEEVMRVQYPDGDTYIIAIISSGNKNGRMALNLGPAWFLEEKDFSVNEGDEVQAKGAKMRTNGRHIFLVTELSMDGETLNIRDHDGSPLWGSPKAQNGNGDSMKNGKKNGKRNRNRNTY